MSFREAGECKPRPRAPLRDAQAVADPTEVFSIAGETRRIEAQQHLRLGDAPHEAERSRAIVAGSARDARRTFARLSEPWTPDRIERSIARWSPSERRADRPPIVPGRAGGWLASPA